MISSFSHIYLPVRNVDDSIEFYTKKLGFYLLRKWRTGDRESAYVGLDGVLLELTLSRQATEATFEGARIGLTVSDLDAVLADLTSKGVEVAREPWEARTFWGRQAQIKDPSGYAISLREYRDPDGPSYEHWQPTDKDVIRTA